MITSLVTFAHRRPGLVVLLLLYTTIACLVARSAVTVSACSVLFVSVAVQVAVVARRARPGSPAHPVGTS